MRTIWKNLDKSNQDLTGIDFTNAYFYRCNFTNSKFRILYNATFVECNLKDVDFTNTILKSIDITNCTGTDQIKFKTIRTLNKVGKILLEKFSLSAFYPLHANKLIAAIMYKNADNATREEVKFAINYMADYITNHPELSWDSFSQYITVRFDKSILRDGIEVSLKDHPYLLDKGREMIRKYG